MGTPIPGQHVGAIAVHWRRVCRVLASAAQARRGPPYRRLPVDLALVGGECQPTGAFSNRVEADPTGQLGTEVR